MKRVLALVAGGLGLGTILRRRRQRPAVGLGLSPADDLRAKLQAARQGDESAVAEPGPAPEPAAEEADALPDDLAARRRSVHDRARDSIDELG